MSTVVVQYGSTTLTIDTGEDVVSVAVDGAKLRRYPDDERGMKVERLSQEIAKILFSQIPDATSTEKAVPALQVANMLATTDVRDVDPDQLGERTRNTLNRGGIKTLLDLASQSEDDLLNVVNFGNNSLREVREYLARSFGIVLPKSK
jgi:DNA-directed RNA polymerase alpha subunit